MTPDNYNAYRANMDAKHLRRHYGIASRAQLIAGAIVFASLALGSLIVLITLVKAWITA